MTYNSHSEPGVAAVDVVAVDPVPQLTASTELRVHLTWTNHRTVARLIAGVCVVLSAHRHRSDCIYIFIFIHHKLVASKRSRKKQQLK